MVVIAVVTGSWWGWLAELLARAWVMWLGARREGESLVAQRPNKRLKLAAPFFYGSLLFVNSSSRRRSLGAFRYAARHVLQIIC